MRIHLGCGKRDWPGWTNVDGADFPHVVHYDVTLQHFHSDQADLLYSSHLLEYFDRDEGLEVLKNWYRVLKPGGVLRLAVPDWDNMIHALRFKGLGLEDILGPLYGKMQMDDRTIYHKTVYNYYELKAALKEAGFMNIRRYDWKKTDHAEFDDHSRAHLPHDPEAIKKGEFGIEHILISLNVEATK